MGERLKIAVNTRFLIKDKLEGIGLFTYESMKRVTQAHRDIDFFFLLDRSYENEFIFGPHVHPMVFFPPARHPLLWYWWYEVLVTEWLNEVKPDLFLSMDGFLCTKANVPQIAVMHDLAYEHYPQHVPWAARKYYKHFMPLSAKKASRIATVSEYSKQDIVKQYDVAPDKIDVVYNGAKEVYRPVSEQMKQRAREQYAAGKNYFIYVGSIHPRKNVSRLLQAFDQFKQQTSSDFKLLLVGRKSWDYSDVDKTYNGMMSKADVHFLGHIPPAELGTLVASAFAMVYVSLFEGFGIPIVEAMSCQVPVITSNTTSMPEAAGDAGLLVDPTSVEEIATGMKQLATDENLRQSLIEKGKAQVHKFSWELTAGKLWACCEKVLAVNTNK